MCPWLKLTFSGDRFKMELFSPMFCLFTLLSVRRFISGNNSSSSTPTTFSFRRVLFFSFTFSCFIKKNHFLFISIHKCSRTPGSRQPSPAEEAVTRPQTLLDPNAFHHQQFQHMLNASMEHHTHAGQLNSFHPPLMNHQMQGAVMNGVNGLQVPQVSAI